MVKEPVEKVIYHQLTRTCFQKKTVHYISSRNARTTGGNVSVDKANVLYERFTRYEVLIAI